jgi:hypothetical protein
VTGLLPCCQQAVLDGLDLTSHALAEHGWTVADALARAEADHG